MKNSNSTLVTYSFGILADDPEITTAHVEQALTDFPGVIITNYVHDDDKPFIDVSVIVDASISHDEAAQMMDALLSKSFYMAG